ncbi:MAG: GNAT family N-acetyltransferase, partial [Acidobacteriota bacterium]
PVDDFPRLLNSRSLYRDPPAGTWSIVCFYVPARHRRKGVAGALLEHALDTIQERGVPCIEAYPVPDRTAKGDPVPPAFAWTGVEAMFRAAGFEAAAPTLGSRMVWRLRPGEANGHGADTAGC